MVAEPKMRATMMNCGRKNGNASDCVEITELGRI
jgi:hypothetical protein